jgi:hypothetical protein
MAATTGTNIVKDGLVMSIDAANIPKNTLSSVEYLIVAGGGSGGVGSGGNTGGGGGGGGGVLTGKIDITPQSYTVTVGDGGAGYTTTANTQSTGGNSGQNSSAFNLTAIGGGGGKAAYGNATTNESLGGGSGGGGCNDDTIVRGNATLGQGSIGGPGISGNTFGGGGGGGGADSLGISGVGGIAASAVHRGGEGGRGKSSNISGTLTFYGGGGGGGQGASGTGFALGGIGGGGRGSNPGAVTGGSTGGAEAGLANSGGGGGGGPTRNGSNANGAPAGGSGIVVIRYPGPQRATGGTVTQVGNDIVHTFTAVGSSTFTVLPPYAQGQAFTTTSDFSGQGNFGTAVNGPTYSTDNNGSFVFDGVDDYLVAQSPGSYPNYTFEFFCRWNAPVTFNRIFGLSNFGTYTILSPTNIGFHYNPAGGSPPSVTLSSNVNVGYGTWCHIAVTVNSLTSLVTIYINGVSRNSWNVMPSGNFLGNLYLGAQNTQGLVSNCNVGTFSLYNRALTAQEIQQNFEALRGRYGI